MITTIMLVSTSITSYVSIPCVYVCVCGGVCVGMNVCVVRTFKTYSFSNFQVSVQYNFNTIQYC